MPTLPNDFISSLSDYKSQIWPFIDEFLTTNSDFPSFCAVPPKYAEILKFHQQIIRNYPERKGKYVRGSLILMTAGALGVDLKKILPVAAAMQLSEDWILVHDDIEDDSLERRGQPALHRQIGPSLAINAGDGLHCLMWQLLSSVSDRRLLDEFFLMIRRTIFGQTIEIKWTNDNRLDLTEDDVLLIMESKTGYYSLAGPMRLGAISAGATDKQLESLYTFGKYLGLCYQIQDDLLDLTSDFSGQKKQMGNDIYEGKRTVMLVHLLNQLPASDRQQLVDILSLPREQKTPKQVSWVISQMAAHGSFEYSKNLIQKYLTLAKNFFESDLQFLKNEPYRQQFLSFMDFIESRQF